MSRPDKLLANTNILEQEELQKLGFSAPAELGPPPPRQVHRSDSPLGIFSSNQGMDGSRLSVVWIKGNRVQQWEHNPKIFHGVHRDGAS